jgi:hypothetical protein
VTSPFVAAVQVSFRHALAAHSVSLLLTLLWLSHRDGQSAARDISRAHLHTSQPHTMASLSFEFNGQTRVQALLGAR